MLYDKDIKEQDNAMGCFDEGMVQAYIDGELHPLEMEKVREHLKICDRCQKKYDEMRAINAFVEKKITINKKTLRLMSKDMAWERFNGQISKICIKKGGVLYMINKYKKAIAGVAAALLIASVIWVAPVRNAAADFLSIFRVSSIEPIAFTQEDFLKIQQQFNEKGIKDIDLRQFGKIKVEGGGREGAGSYSTDKNGNEVLDINSIKRDLGVEFSVPKVPDGFKLSSVNVEKAGRIEITPNVDNLNKLITTFGGEKLFPKALEGKTFVITTKDIVQLNYSDKAAGNTSNTINKRNKTKFRYLSITQMATPDINVPQGVDIEAVRAAAISLPFLPENIRQQLADIKDWKNTLPFPVDDGTTTKEVTINGSKGVLISNQYGPEKDPIYNTTLVFINGENIYQINGSLPEQEIIKIADSLR